MILVLLLVALAVGCPVFLRRLQQERASQRLASQFRAALQNIVHALRVGVGFQQALDYAAREGEQPLAAEWAHVLQEVRLGQTLSEALEGFAARVALRETRWFVTAVSITQNTGGSLADVLETLAVTLQERQTLREKVAALTAQGKASGVLLAILPYALMGALAVVAPDMARVLFQTAKGQMIVVGVTVSLVIGGLLIKKIVAIEVD